MREIDIEIAKAIGLAEGKPVPYYTKDISAAWDLFKEVKKLPNEQRKIFAKALYSFEKSKGGKKGVSLSALLNLSPKGISEAFLKAVKWNPEEN